MSSQNTVLKATSFIASWGGVGPAAVSGPDAWLVLVLDVEADAQRTGVEVKDVELLDAATTVVARATPPYDIRRDAASDAERRRDLSRDRTTPFDGTLTSAQSVRLYVHAKLDASLAAAMRAAPTRFRARVAAAGGPAYQPSLTIVEGTLEPPWATAGPAVPH